MNAGTPQLIGPRHLQLLARRWPLSGRAILNDAQWRLNAMLNRGDFRRIKGRSDPTPWICPRGKAVTRIKATFSIPNPILMV